MVWWWIGNAILLVVVIPLVIVLADRVVRRALEIKGYAADVLEHGVGITGNLDPIPELVRTRDLVRAAREGAEQYGAAVGRLLGEVR